MMNEQDGDKELFYFYYPWDIIQYLTLNSLQDYKQEIGLAPLSLFEYLLEMTL